MGEVLKLFVWAFVDNAIKGISPCDINILRHNRQLLVASMSFIQYQMVDLFLTRHSSDLLAASLVWEFFALGCFVTDLTP
jgi:hypothetical protein